MNKDRIAKLLEEPARVAREDLAGLRELKGRYPWFSGAHLLLALGEHASGDVLFDATLKTTAAHLPSREILFDEVERGKGKGQRESAIHADLDATSSVESKPEAQVPSSGAIAPSRDDIAERILEQQIIEAAAASAYAIQTALRPTPAIEIPDLPPPTEQHQMALPGEQPATADLSPRSFTTWLASAPVAIAPEVSFDNASTVAGSAQDWLRGSPDDLRDGPAQAPSTGPSPSPERTRDVIDRFLQHSTPQTRKTEFFSPQQAGRSSIEEQLDLVTETLARIHEKQGHWAKAAEAYQRLALKHPEKSGYFAALAKNAQQHLNS